MNYTINFTDNEDLGKLISSFSLCQEKLYHYTNQKAGKNIILTNELWITRADDLLDKEEVKYGIEILTKVAEKILQDRVLFEFMQILKLMESNISNFFIICFSESPKLNKHKEIHGDFIIEFSSAIGLRLISNGIHNSPIGSINYTQDEFISFEGYVNYEQHKQESQAKIICDIFNKGLTSILDKGQFIDCILIFIMLTKKYMYNWEKEYRIGFFSQTILYEDILRTSEDGKHKIFINLPEEVEKFKKYNS